MPPYQTANDEPSDTRLRASSTQKVNCTHLVLGARNEVTSVCRDRKRSDLMPVNTYSSERVPAPGSRYARSAPAFRRRSTPLAVSSYCARRHGRTITLGTRRRPSAQIGTSARCARPDARPSVTLRPLERQVGGEPDRLVVKTWLTPGAEVGQARKSRTCSGAWKSSASEKPWTRWTWSRNHRLNGSSDVPSAVKAASRSSASR